MSIESLHRTVQTMPEAKAAATLVLAGGAGSFAQAATEWANILVTCGNAVLVMGGLYLMYHKIFKRDKK